MTGDNFSFTKELFGNENPEDYKKPSKCCGFLYYFPLGKLYFEVQMLGGRLFWLGLILIYISNYESCLPYLRLYLIADPTISIIL